ncbi:galactosylgalactosylxylosylprotein 3-beta-glucuronosyltransferase S-like [Rhipicephalus sanguineus]|uniref:galactosylgalactosylxylosylprotein 3-beta-glucuronosyltransferase S-like n=1 Tax=Rhipicephalus sanguineus TaxID=34632 RepID=UPI0018953DC5|nr:galactosylgalactosylxylosylprotein 3-beta-glucuronosyltransferase S-like [Rhipicephalus sanguineus]XP_037516354.1 galactosylgalactosylxylosylprotein 3-beta-glucuronosyltransferase S-like [Rhipicephalus sanguineus]
MAPPLRGRILLLIVATMCATILFLCGFQIRPFGGRRVTRGDASAGCLQWMPVPSPETFTETEAPAVPTVYVVTPTYRRPTQMPDLVRVAQALMLATGVFWVLVEDSTRPTEAVSRLLRDCSIPHVHLLGPCPQELRTRAKGRGVSARRTALAWLQANATLPGVLYFADDDNTYDYRLFDEIRWTQAVSVFPVGSMKITGFSSPVVVDGSVVGFHDPYLHKRRFAVDMAGFAVNLRLLINNTNISMPHMEGRQETEFLESLNVSLSDLEPLCENATKVLVWHTQSKPSAFPTAAKINRKYLSLKTNLNALIRYINY